MNDTQLAAEIQQLGERVRAFVNRTLATPTSRSAFFEAPAKTLTQAGFNVPRRNRAKIEAQVRALQGQRATYECLGCILLVGIMFWLLENITIAATSLVLDFVVPGVVVIGLAIILDPINQLAMLALAIPAATVACQFLGFCPIYPELAAKAADGPTRIEP